MLYVSDPSTVPQGGWMYPHPTNGFVTTHNFAVFYEKILVAYNANNVPAPSWDTVVKWVCENQYVSCREDNVAFVNRFTQQLPNAPRGGCCG